MRPMISRISVALTDGSCGGMSTLPAELRHAPEFSGTFVAI